MADELREINKNIKELSQNIKQSFDKIGQHVGKQINDIMTPELNEVADAIKTGIDATKDSGKALLGFFGAGLTDDAKMLANSNDTANATSDMEQLMRGSTPATKGLKTKDVGLHKILKDQNKMEKQRLKILKREERRKRGLFSIKKKSWLVDLLGILIGVPIAIIAAGIGAALAFIVQPFLVIKKIFSAAKILPAIKLLGKFFATLIGLDLAVLSAKVANIFKGEGKIARFFRFFGKIGKWVSNIWRMIEGMPFIGRLLRFGVRGFAAGFSKIFWPLQIVISVIDFVKGFMETEGTILDKIQGGIKNVIVKFFEWPLQLIGKLFDWVLTKLGLEKFIAEGGTAVALIDGLGKGVDMIFEGWKLIFGGIAAGVEAALEWIGPKLAAFDFQAFITKIIDGIAWFLKIPERIKNWILEKLGFEEELNEEDKKKIGLAESGAYDEKERRMREGEQAALKRQIEERARQENAIFELQKEQAKYNKEMKEQMEKKGEMGPIVMPQQPKQGNEIPLTADPETSQNNYSLIVPAN